VLVGYGLYRGGVVAANARVLQIDRIAVGGNKWLSDGEVLAILAGLRGESLMWTDLAAWRKRLLASPWVKDAALRRSLPATVEVMVSEREPVGLGRLQGTLYLMDEQGVLMDEYGPQYADLDLPVVDGLTTRRAVSGTAAVPDPSRAQFAARLIASLAPDQAVARQLSQVDVGDLHNAAVTLSGDAAVIYVGEDHFLERLVSYLGLAAALRERVPDIAYVDLRFDDRIYVRPAGKADNRGAIVVPTWKP
jgi:cell division protein FtsQ